MKPAITLFTVVVASVGPCAPHVFAEDNVTAAQAVKAYRAYLGRLQNVTFSSVFKDRNVDKSDVPTNGMAQSWKIDFAGRRMWRTSRMVLGPASLRGNGERPHWEEQYSETLVTQKARYEISVDAATKTATAMGGYVHVPKDYWTTQTGFGYLAYPFGYAQDGGIDCRSTLDMLRDVTVASDESGKATLSSVTDEYQLRVRLDPNKGWMADQITCTYLNKYPDGNDHETCSYEVTASSLHDGVWIPDAYRCRQEVPAHEFRPKNLRVVRGRLMVVSDGSDVGEPYVVKLSASTTEAEVALADISLQPLGGADFQVQARVPTMLPVSMQDDFESEYVWEGGKVVKVSEAPSPKRR